MLGSYMAKVFTGKRTFLDPVLVPIERLVLRLTGVDPNKQQDWKQYSVSLVVSNIFMWLATFAIVSLQKVLPLNPDGIANMEPTLAFNTISSFTTNTNLQHYSGETGLSYFSQMFVITLSAVRDCRDRHRGGRRDHSWPRRQSSDGTRQFLRRHDPRDRSPFPAARAAGLRLPDVAGHADDLRGRRAGDDARRPDAGHCPGRDGRRRVDQATGHERRRLFRTELGAPVRKPDASIQFRRDLVDHDHPDVDGGDARFHAESPEARRRDLCDDAGDLSPDGRRSASRRKLAATRRSRGWASISPPARWRARKSASAPVCQRSGA